MKTYTPELDPAVVDRLRDYAGLFADDFPQSKPALWAGVYLQGLLLDGERKSIEPLARRITLPDWLTGKDLEQALQQFVNQSPWDERPVLRRYRTAWPRRSPAPKGSSSSTTSCSPKQGARSVGVQRHTAGPWARRPTARWRRPSTTSAPGATTRWTSASICPKPG